MEINCISNILILIFITLINELTITISSTFTLSGTKSEPAKQCIENLGSRVRYMQGKGINLNRVAL